MHHNELLLHSATVLHYIFNPNLEDHLYIRSILTHEETGSALPNLYAQKGCYLAIYNRSTINASHRSVLNPIYFHREPR